MATASMLSLSPTPTPISSNSSSTPKPLQLSPPLKPHAAPTFPQQRRNQVVSVTLRREVILKGLATAVALPLLVLKEAPPSSAKEVEVGSYLPTSPSDPSFVLFKASPRDTPALRAALNFCTMANNIGFSDTLVTCYDQLSNDNSATITITKTILIVPNACCILIIIAAFITSVRPVTTHLYHACCSHHQHHPFPYTVIIIFLVQLTPVTVATVITFITVTRNVQPYQFILPPTWKQLRIANILSGNYCQPKCAEPWVEVKFEDEKQGKVQVVASPLIRLTNKPNSSIEEIGSPEKLIASLGPFVTGNTYDPDELLEMSVEKRGDQTYYKYVLETPFALTGSHNLAKATAKGNTVVLFVASANDKQWQASEKTLKAMLDSFQV
uniref:PsbP C-terminal domain-containing protein n=1 Tax=Fagus sylvatica TaxID=28930 RepID=A0A2N9H822_FAGSY